MIFKKIICIFLFLGLFACSFNPSSEEIIESKEPFVVQFFYCQTCPHCKQLKENLFPLLMEEFNDQISIEEYDIDETECVDLYDSYIGLYDEDTQTWVKNGLLEGVPEEVASYNRYIPFVVVGDMYAFMGYTQELLEDYVKDVHYALQNQPLTKGEVANGRWLFKQTP